jgi:protein-tyrosine phosphatase
MSAAPVRVCFVCLGNICRSPTAEGVMKQLLEAAGIGHAFAVTSAGTGNWHVGELPDPRTRAEAKRRGVALTSRARHFTHALFADTDYVIAMDRQNQRDILRLARTKEDESKVLLLRSFARGEGGEHDVPDPYFGEGDGFSNVYDICHAACTALLTHLREKHGL